MVRVIYGDVLLLVDFCMNCFALYITAYLIRRHVKTLCLVGAALVGGIYNVAAVYLNTDNLLAKLTAAAVGLLMCYIAFGGYHFVRTALTFFAVSALIGGLMYGVYFLFGSYHTDLFGNTRGYAYTHIPLWMFAALAGVSFILAVIFSRLGRDVTDRREATVTVTTANGCKVLHLLLDSGNLVREPISGKYVLIVGLDAVAPLLTDAERRAIADRDADALLRRRFRLICARGMDGTPRTLYGFVPDSIVYTDGKKSVKLDAYLAPTPIETGFCGFEGIAHPSAIA